MKRMAIVFAFLFITTPAGAQTDWDADNYGVFFDTGGTQTTTDASAGLVIAYLVLLNPTVPDAQITGWEAGCWTVREIGPDHHFPVGPAMPLIYIPLDGLITYPVVCDGGTWVGGGPQTLPGSSAVALGRFEVGVIDLKPYGFYDHFGTGIMTRDGEPDIPLTTSTRTLSTMPPLMWLAATINSDYVPVPVENVGWGAVKALFR